MVNWGYLRNKRINAKKNISRKPLYKIRGDK